MRSFAWVVLPEPSIPSITMYGAVMDMFLVFGVLIFIGWVFGGLFILILNLSETEGKEVKLMRGSGCYVSCALRRR